MSEMPTLVPFGKHIGAEVRGLDVSQPLDDRAIGWISDALADHGKTPHMGAFGGKIAGLLAGRPEITRLDPVASIA